MNDDLTPQQQERLTNALATIQELQAYTVMQKDPITHEWRIVVGTTVRGQEAARKKLQEYKNTFKKKEAPTLQVVPKPWADFIRANYKAVRREMLKKGLSSSFRVPRGMYMPDNL
jgi:hypothetical protein